MSSDKDTRNRQLDAQRKSSLLQRLGTQLARGATRILKGYDVAFLDDMVSTLGLKGMGEWAERMERVRAQAEETLGLVQSEHAIAFAALLHGCPFCSVSHFYVGNLALFDSSGALFPVDERDVRRLQQLTDVELLRRVGERLDAYPDTRSMFQRIQAIKSGEELVPQDGDEALRSIVLLWDLLIECTILQYDLDPADIDPIHVLAKDKQLRRRYRAAREAASAR